MENQLRHRFSILFENPDTPVPAEIPEPQCFHDLNLDRMADAICVKSQRNDLRSIYYVYPPSIGDMTYRQRVMRDFEGESLLKNLRRFSDGIRKMRSHLDYAEKSPYQHEKSRLRLRAAETYVGSLLSLKDDLRSVSLRSEGCFNLSGYLDAYLESPSFRALKEEARNTSHVLNRVQYCLVVNGGTVTVRKCEGEENYTPMLEEVFERFRHGSAKNYLAKISHQENVNHVQNMILERVALLYPEEFSMLESFAAAHAAFADPVILRFEEELQFYLSYLEYIEPLKSAGLPFCYPEISDSNKEIEAAQTYDLILAQELLTKKSSVVTNDFFLRDPERIFVVSGPNQGGKTTFARMLGQLHHLANLGCAVPGRKAKLFHFDRVLTHFEKSEDVTSLRGKLQDELIRMKGVFDEATPRSVLIINEAFSSAALKDEIFLGERILERISKLDAIAVFVSFVDELSTLNEKTVSILATVDSRDLAKRTFKIERRPADGLAYALAIAEKYRLTHDQLLRRIG